MRLFPTFVSLTKQRTALFVASFGILLASVAPAKALTIQQFGTGTSYADLIIQDSAFGTEPLYYRYFFSGPSIDGYALLVATDNAFANISFDIVGSAYLNAITYNGTTLTSTAYPAVGPYWGQWVSGGQAGYPAAEPVPSGEWNYGGGISDPYRVMTSGSADGWAFNAESTPPTVLPVPEPQTAMLLATGAMVVVTWRRRRVVA